MGRTTVRLWRVWSRLLSSSRPARVDELLHVRPHSFLRPPEPAAARCNFSHKDYVNWENGVKQGVRLMYCGNEARADAAVHQLWNSKHLGFDMEWDPFGPIDTALVQLCNEETISLFHLSRIRRMPQSLKSILESTEHLKFGVAVVNDGKRLQKSHGVCMGGLMELSHLAKVVDVEEFGTTRTLVALASLSRYYLEKALPKPKSLRMSNWRRTLQPRQQCYAADDAYSGLQIFFKINDRRQQREPVPRFGPPVSIPLDQSAEQPLQQLEDGTMEDRTADRTVEGQTVEDKTAEDRTGLKDQYAAAKRNPHPMSSEPSSP